MSLDNKDILQTNNEWISVNGKKFLLVDDTIFQVVDFDEWSDGDFEADCITDTIRVLVSKNNTGYYVANAVDGHGMNIRASFEKSKVVLLTPLPSPPQNKDNG